MAVNESPLLVDILRWMGIVGIGSALMMGLDKLVAKMHAWRISERSFFFVALIGGVLGVIVGAIIFHHKTSKTSFWPGILLALGLWSIVLLAAAR
jgi:uncharacterized membrane protein YsdA (DUF1294 family)